jgi:hypothetical protein
VRSGREASGYASDAPGYASDASGYASDAPSYASAVSRYASATSSYASVAPGSDSAASRFALAEQADLTEAAAVVGPVAHAEQAMATATVGVAAALGRDAAAGEAVIEAGALAREAVAAVGVGGALEEVGVGDKGRTVHGLGAVEQRRVDVVADDCVAAGIGRVGPGRRGVGSGGRRDVASTVVAARAEQKG